MSELELAWAAGFFDGEGCTTLSTQMQLRSGKFYEYNSIHLNVNQVDREVLDRFQRAVGLGRVGGPYSKKGPNQQDQYSYRCGAIQEVRFVLEALWPYLGSVKKLQALDKIEQYEVAHRTVNTRYNKEVITNASSST